MWLIPLKTSFSPFHNPIFFAPIASNFFNNIWNDKLLKIGTYKIEIEIWTPIIISNTNNFDIFANWAKIYRPNCEQTKPPILSTKSTHIGSGLTPQCHHVSENNSIKIHFIKHRCHKKSPYLWFFWPIIYSIQCKISVYCVISGTHFKF
jgi:hypothetical protein